MKDNEIEVNGIKNAVTYNYSENFNEIVVKQKSLNDYVVKNKFRIVHKYIDKRGNDPHRLELNDMLNNIERYNYIICYDIASLSDSVYYLSRILLYLLKHNVNLVFVKDDDNIKYDKLMKELKKELI